MQNAMGSKTTYLFLSCAWKNVSMTMTRNKYHPSSASSHSCFRFLYTSVFDVTSNFRYFYRANPPSLADQGGKELKQFSLSFLSASVGDDYDSEDYNDGSCSYRAVNCAPGALCSQNLEHTRFKCYCPEGFSGDGYSEEFRAGATGCSMIGGTVEVFNF